MNPSLNPETPSGLRLNGLTPGEKGTAPPTGLRMNGLYAAPGGFNLEFDVSNAVVACGPLGIAASQPSCQQAVDATSQNSIAMARVDGSGRAQFPAVPAASYYVFAAAMHNSKLVMWNTRVDLKAGANSVTLDLSDAARIE